jgi:hypothetical protein
LRHTAIEASHQTQITFDMREVDKSKSASEGKKKGAEFPGKHVVVSGKPTGTTISIIKHQLFREATTYHDRETRGRHLLQRDR